MASYDDVRGKYITIKNRFEDLRTYLIKQLKKCYLTDIDDYNFTELIEAIEQIQCVQYENSNNIKPLVKPKIDNSNLSKYNETLYLRIRYYMKFVAYFLILNGVSNDEVAKQTTLTGLISLLDQMDIKIPSTLNIQSITEDYYFGSGIILDYELFDINNEQIYDGDIEIRSGDIIYDYIPAGEPLIFTPIEISEKVNGVYQPTIFTFTYLGNDKYQSAPTVTKEIVIRPAKIKLELTATNITPESKYYNSTTTGYNTDTWKIDIKTYNFKNEILPDIPFTLSIGDYIIADITDETGVYSTTYSITERGSHTINVETTYENTDLLTNVTTEYQVEVYYNPLYQEHKNYIDYAGKNQYTYTIIIKDEDTGENSSHLNGQIVNLFLNDEQIDNITINDGQAQLNISNFEEGEYLLRWVIDNNQISTNIKILSNFILPTQTKFFLPETPDIIYAPLNTELYGTNEWVPMQSQHATGIISYDTEETNLDTLDLYTNNQGVLHAIKEYQYTTSYELELTTASNNLNESVQYIYEINKPFILTLDSYYKEQYAQYIIDIYDMNNYDIGDYIECIDFDRNIFNDCTISEYTFDDYYEITVLIPITDNTIGKNTITFSQNGYTESDTFKLYRQVFELLTNTVTVGNNNIEIRCYDNEIEEINIENDYIIINEITKENDIFIINADFIQSGIINFTVYDEDDAEKDFNINVLKANIDASISIQETIPNGTTRIIYNEDTEEEEVIDLIQEVSEFEYINIDNIKVFLDIDMTLYDDITIVYSIDDNEIETYIIQKESTTTETESSENDDINTDINEDDKYFLIPDIITPGEHTVNFAYYANSSSNYNSFSVSKSFIIHKSIPKYKLINQRPGYIE